MAAQQLTRDQMVKTGQALVRLAEAEKLILRYLLERHDADIDPFMYNIEIGQACQAMHISLKDVYADNRNEFPSPIEPGVIGEGTMLRLNERHFPIEIQAEVDGTLTTIKYPDEGVPEKRPGVIRLGRYAVARSLESSIAWLDTLSCCTQLVYAGVRNPLKAERPPIHITEAVFYDESGLRLNATALTREVDYLDWLLTHGMANLKLEARYANDTTNKSQEPKTTEKIHRKRGRKPASDEKKKEEEDLLLEWEADEKRRSRQEFADDHEMSLDDFDALQSRVRGRRRREQIKK